LPKLKLFIAGASALALLGGGAALAAGAQASSLPRLPSLHGPDIHLQGHPAAATRGIPVQQSGNWSGYVAVPTSGTTTTFKQIYAQYTVPSVNCTPSGSNNSFAYHWIGLDGFTDSTVEQDGVAAFCNAGTPAYDAWWEMYPSGLQLAFALNAGDAITSEVTYTTAGYTLSLTDETSKKSFKVTEACPSGSTCENSSAEDITEGYTATGWVGTADFGQEFYNSTQVEDSAGVLGALNNPAWSTWESVAYGSTSGQPMAQPGQLYNGSVASRSAFEITWERVD
jgi:hypothetical protein